MSSDITTRAQVVTLKSFTTKTTREIAVITGLSVATVNRVYAQAIQRGYDHHADPMIRDVFVQDAPRSGRPSKQTETTKELVTSKIRRDRYGREKTCANLAGELSLEGLDLSSTTIWRLKSCGFNKTKPTRKPGLTKKMKAERLAWCL